MGVDINLHVILPPDAVKIRVTSVALQHAFCFIASHTPTTSVF
jgi:hypothetical protein